MLFYYAHEELNQVVALPYCIYVVLIIYNHKFTRCFSISIETVIYEGSIVQDNDEMKNPSIKKYRLRQGNEEENDNNKGDDNSNIMFNFRLVYFHVSKCASFST